MKKTKKARKPSKAKKPKAPKVKAAKVPKLVITVLNDCTLENNQNLNPPHLCRSADGGYPHQVEFTAVTHAWVCLKKGYFSNAPNGPIELDAGVPAGPYIVKGTAALGDMPFTHSCADPCTDDRANGDSIIIES